MNYLAAELIGHRFYQPERHPPQYFHQWASVPIKLFSNMP